MARTRAQRQRQRPALYQETLEAGHQPSTLELHEDFSDTLPFALDLTPELMDHSARVATVIGDNAAGGGDVDWYRLDLADPATVTFTLAGSGGVISLYNTDSTSADPTVAALGRRLLEQTTSSGGQLGVLSRALAPGSYYVAVSG